MGYLGGEAYEDTMLSLELVSMCVRPFFRMNGPAKSVPVFVKTLCGGS